MWGFSDFTDFKRAAACSSSASASASAIAQLSHCSGSGSSVIKFGHDSHVRHSVCKNCVISWSVSVPCGLHGIFTVKFLPAAITIFTSPSSANSSGDNCDVSRLAAKISCSTNLASKLCAGAVTIDGNFELLMKRPPRHFV